MSTTVIIDATNTWCPVPILRLAQGLRTLPQGAEVQLLATDPAVEGDVVAFCESTGNLLLAQDREGETFRATVRKG